MSSTANAAQLFDLKEETRTDKPGCASKANAHVDILMHGHEYQTLKE